MATAKKKTPAKKTTAKKTPARRAPAKRTTTTATAAAPQREFSQTKVTDQTVYWLIIGALVIALAAWVLSLQLKLNDAYDQINVTTDSTPVEIKKADIQ